MATTAGPTMILPAWKTVKIRTAGVDLTTTVFNSNSTAFGTYVAGVFMPEESITCTRVAFYQSTSAGAATKVLRCGIQAVSATTGLPNGTWTYFGDYTVTSANNATFVSVALGTSATLTRGTAFAVVLEPRSGFGASDTITINRNHGTDSYASNAEYLPYICTNGAKTINSAPLYAYGTSTTWYGYPWSAEANDPITTQESGNSIKLICSGVKAFRVTGVRVWGHTANTNDTQLNIYDTVNGTTPMANATASMDTDVIYARSAIGNSRVYYFNGAIDLQAGTKYYLAIKRTSGTNDQNHAYLDFKTGGTDYFKALNQNYEAYYITRATAGTGSFTETTTRRMVWDLYIDGYESTAGSSGGMIVHPGMGGGMRG